MGGGDLNLKKSWHPSTMKNMERVWKAEQQDSEEKKKIAELKREMDMERDREHFKTFAMEHGAIEKKDDKKLDWMYKGPQQNVNREEYLLGRKIDKQFEQMVQSEKDAEQNKPVKNHVEHECIPPSLRFFSGDDQVDLQRKLQEDPLYAIKKKEMDSRAQLLKNPVKLKQLQQLVAQQNQKDKDKSDKKKKKKKKKSSDSDDSDVDKKLNILLAAKYKKLKGKISEKDLIKSVKKHKKNKKSKKKSKKKDSSDSSDSDSDSSSDSSSDESIKHTSKKDKRKEEVDKYGEIRHSRIRNSDEYDRYSDDKYKRRRETSRERSYNRSLKSHRHHSNEEDRNSREVTRGFGLMNADGTKIHSSRKRSSSRESPKVEEKVVKKEQKWVPPKRQKLTEEEKEKRRQEMIQNASARDKEREKNVKRYVEEQSKESIKDKSFDKEFVKRHLTIAADKETVASRIKSNINNIQRTKHAMDRNFARR